MNTAKVKRAKLKEREYTHEARSLKQCIRLSKFIKAIANWHWYYA